MLHDRILPVDSILPAHAKQVRTDPWAKTRHALAAGLRRCGETRRYCAPGAILNCKTSSDVWDRLQVSAIALYC